MDQRVSGWRHRFGTLLSGLVLLACINIAPPALAAEWLSVQLGPFQVSVSIADLEVFAQTGQVAPALQPYQFLLTSKVQQALSSKVSLNPSVGDSLITELLNSTNGDRLLHLLQRLVVDSTREDITTAMLHAVRQSGELSLLGILREYPENRLMLDLKAVIMLLAQMSHPQQQAIGTLLGQGLTVPTMPFQTGLDPTALGTATVQRQMLTLRDQSRDRTILTELYWSLQHHGPLVVLSHGFAADHRFLSYLGEHLASYGFTVVAIEHPASSRSWLTQLTDGRWISHQKPALLPAAEFVDRPKDIQFLLNELEQLERQSSQFHNLFNTEQVTVIGHSLGGYTALALAGAELRLDSLRAFCNCSNRIDLTPADWLQCTAADLPDESPILQDARVAQIIALNPVVGNLFSPESLARIRVPAIILSSSEDTMTLPLQHQILPFYRMKTEKYLLAAIGATHMSTGTPDFLNEDLLKSIFVHERRSEETEPLRHMLKGVSLAFVQQLTPKAVDYRPFLSSAYIQSLSTYRLHLRFATELPLGVIVWLKGLEAVGWMIVTSPYLSMIWIGIPLSLKNLSWLNDGYWFLCFVAVSQCLKAGFRKGR